MPADAVANDARQSASSGAPATLVIILLSAWIGAVLFFSAVIAPAAFRVLPSRASAGAVVGAALPTLFIAGMVAAVLVMLALLRFGASRRSRAVGFGAAGSMLAALFVGQVVIGGRIARLREALGAPLDALPQSHPLRVEFGQLHGYSVLALGIAVVAAVILLAMLVTRWRVYGHA